MAKALDALAYRGSGADVSAESSQSPFTEVSEDAMGIIVNNLNCDDFANLDKLATTSQMLKLPSDVLQQKRTLCSVSLVYQKALHSFNRVFFNNQMKMITETNIQALGNSLNQEFEAIDAEKWVDIQRGIPGFHVRPPHVTPPQTALTNDALKAFQLLVEMNKLSHVTNLRVAHGCLDDDAMIALSNTFSRGALPSLTKLTFFRNQIGDKGMIAFADAITPTEEFHKGALASLQSLEIDDNEIGDGGMEAFSTALSSNALTSLVILKIQKNRFGTTGTQKFSDAINAGSLANLTRLFCDETTTNLRQNCETRNIEMYEYP